ncbi:uncharacterized protein TNCV_3462731 [Trichonephila clavipes]|nr:uncharacterized protein TNCV_3462731 [Trichonephila clavipes]
MVSGGTEFALGDIEILFEEARRNTKANMKNGRNIIIDAGVMCKLRKCDETEIGTGSSRITVVYAMNRVVLKEYNGDQMSRKMVKRKGQRSIPSSWSEKSRMIKRSKNERLGYKRSHESLSRLGGPERMIQKGLKHRVPKRALSSNYRTNYNLPKFRKKEKVTPTTSGYNLRPRNGKRVESRPTIERKKQQGGPVRSRKGRGRNDSPTSKSEQDQATRMPDEKVINNGKTRKGKERVRESLYSWRSW